MSARGSRIVRQRTPKARLDAGLNVLAARLRTEGLPDYVVEVIVALRQHCEEADQRLPRLERAK